MSNNTILAFKSQIADKFFPNETNMPPAEMCDFSLDLIDQIIERKPFAETAGCGYVHPIVYCLIKSPNNEYLSYQRTSKGGESRLHGEHSIGVGGHLDVDVNLENIDPFQILKNNLINELNEEICLPTEWDENAQVYTFSQGNCQVDYWIYDRTTEVNSLHLGMVVQFHLTQDGYNIVMSNIQNNKIEDHLHNVSFKSLENLMENFNTYESWSQMLIQKLVYHEETQTPFGCLPKNAVSNPKWENVSRWV